TAVIARPLLAAVAALLLHHSAAVAQDPPILSPGDQVRVELVSIYTPGVGANWTTGIFERSAADSLWLRLPQVSSLMLIEPGQYQRVTVRIPRTKGDGAAMGALIGGLAGVGAGMLLIGTVADGGDEGGSAQGVLLIGGGIAF